MRVGLLSFAIAACLTASPALAEKWRASSKGDGATAYIDVDSIKRKGDRVTFWRELRWPEVRSLSGNVRFDRMAGLHEADCKSMTLRTLKVRVSLGDDVLFKGDAEAEEPQVQEPGSNGAIDLRSACLDEWPG